MQSNYGTDEQRWRAVIAREAAADDHFIYGVITTGIYCHPSCPSRLALREHVRFYENREQAGADGMKPCKRCGADKPPLLVRQGLLMERACRLIRESDVSVKVEFLAAQLGVSRFQLRKLFHQFLGIGPKQYIKAVRAKQLSTHLATKGATVTEAFLDAGYDSSSAYYADGAARLGMSASVYRQHGNGLKILYAFGRCELGQIVVATTSKGICSILFGDTPTQLLLDLGARFQQATLTPAPEKMQALIDDVIRGIENPQLARTLPLDIQGTAFQEKVWTALRDIAPGQTQSYSDVAARIGQPKAARAVAKACSDNPVAVLVPCHRVVAASGKLSGYRWGTERKRQLLEWEEDCSE